jgi:hypothetical protein
VTDRLAFLNFVHGSLSASLAVKLDDARSPLKALRSAEVAIVPKRNIRAGLRNQIARIEHNQEKGGERRLAELKEQLSRAESNDEQLEKEIELLKRKAVRESEQRKWEALHEVSSLNKIVWPVTYCYTVRREISSHFASRETHRWGLAYPASHHRESVHGCRSHRCCPGISSACIGQLQAGTRRS